MIFFSYRSLLFTSKSILFGSIWVLFEKLYVNAQYLIMFRDSIRKSLVLAQLCAPVLRDEISVDYLQSSKRITFLTLLTKQSKWIVWYKVFFFFLQLTNNFLKTTFRYFYCVSIDARFNLEKKMLILHFKLNQIL